MNMEAMENTVGFLSSGASLEPKSTSESDPMIHRSFRNWTLMLHANAFLVDTQQTGPRGGDKLFSVNWLMPMLSRQFGRHSVTLRSMFSLEPATVTKRRYPELLQSGETAYGAPIVDGQHPHEFIMELAARYDFRWTDRTRVFIYGGPVAEPALGPTAYPHRSSASENPGAVLGHHQQDSTHIANNVITVGLVDGLIQLEASTFHGREPNENRWNIDGGAPDSFSSRLTVGMGMNLLGQFSMGRINSREALEPDLDALRTTASLHHNYEFASGHISSSLIWGRNKDFGAGRTHVLNAYTLESTANFAHKNWAWTRIENVERELGGRVQAFTFGYEREVGLGLSPAMNTAFGAQITTYGLKPEDRALYGNHPVAVSVFMRLRPKGNMMEHMRLMHRR